MSAQDYEVHIRPLSEEDGGGYLENVFGAINCWIEVERKRGRAAPGPR